MTKYQSKQFRYLFGIISGATPESNKPEYWDGDIAWVTPEDVSSVNSHLLRGTRRKITTEGYRSCGTRLADAGAIVLTKRAPIGQIAVLGLPACSNQGCFLLSPRDDVDAQFYYYFLSSRATLLQALGRGSTFMELSTDDLKSLRAPNPNTSVQKAIAFFLDRETARIDALISAKQRQLDLIAEKRKAMIASAVTRGIDPAAPMRDSGVPWLGEMPAHWEIERARWLFRERDERGQPDLSLMEVSISTGVTVREFTGGKIEATAEDFNSYKAARAGDVAFNKMRMWQGAVGIAPTDGLVSPDYVVAAPLGRLLSAYAGTLFRIEQFSAECGRRSHGITWDRLRIYWDEFREIEIPVPPEQEQAAIVAYLVRETAKLDNVCNATEQTIELLKERRSALIAAAVTGQIEVG